MAVPVRRMLRRKWLQAAGNVETAQKYLLEIQQHYKDKHQTETKATDAALMIAEQLHTFLEECANKT